jgi:hypothetical protein
MHYFAGGAFLTSPHASSASTAYAVPAFEIRFSLCHACAGVNPRPLLPIHGGHLTVVLQLDSRIAEIAPAAV